MQHQGIAMGRRILVGLLVMLCLQAQAACQCACVNGETVNICERPYDAPKICAPQVCPPTRPGWIKAGQ